MAKLGYTFYPKDWGNSEHVFELNLSERGLYREFIDLAMLNNNKTEIKKEVWVRKFAVSLEDLETILSKLLSLNLIEFKGDVLFVPSCETRLKLVRGGSNGGKKSKPTPKPIGSLPLTLLRNNEKPTPKQREIEREIESKKEYNIINNATFSQKAKTDKQWIETIAMQSKIKPEIVMLYVDNFESHLITMQEQKDSENEFKRHCTYWLNKQDLSQFRERVVGKTNQI